MQLSYRSLFTDANNIEYSVVKTHGANCLCLQGDLKSLKRLKKSYLSSVYFMNAHQRILLRLCQ